MANFETLLKGGHPNSLGRTTEIVDIVLAERSNLAELFDCYASADPLVRLRTSNALKRIEAERHDWLIPWLDRLIDALGALDQPSAQWTLAQLSRRLAADMSPAQHARATAILKRNLAASDDWIVLTMTMETLSDWSKIDPDLGAWLRPQLDRLSMDRRKSVAKRAAKLLKVGAE